MRCNLPTCGRLSSQLVLYTGQCRTNENRGIEAFSIPRFSGCAGAIQSMYREVSFPLRLRIAA